MGRRERSGDVRGTRSKAYLARKKLVDDAAQRPKVRAGDEGEGKSRAGVGVRRKERKPA